jgi:hypothetical protein
VLNLGGNHQMTYRRLRPLIQEEREGERVAESASRVDSSLGSMTGVSLARQFTRYM